MRFNSKLSWAPASPCPAVSWSGQVILTGSQAGFSVCLVQRRCSSVKLGGDLARVGFASCLLVESPVVKWCVNGLCAFTSQFAELFSGEIPFWLLQQQLIHKTVLLQEGEPLMPCRPPTIGNYPSWDNSSLKRGGEKLVGVFSPLNCGCEQGWEICASMWIWEIPLHMLNSSSGSFILRMPAPDFIILFSNILPLDYCLLRSPLQVPMYSMCFFCSLGPWIIGCSKQFRLPPFLKKGGAKPKIGFGLNTVNVVRDYRILEAVENVKLITCRWCFSFFLVLWSRLKHNIQWL